MKMRSRLNYVIIIPPVKRRAKKHNITNVKDKRFVKPKKMVIRRELVPVLEKLGGTVTSPNKNTYHRFIKTMDVVLDNMDYVDSFDRSEVDMDDEERNVPSELLIPKHQLTELCNEAAKLKALGAMETIPTDKIVKLLKILEINIRNGSRVSPLGDPDDDEDDSRLWLELTMESINRGILASLTALHVLTSPNMPKRVYLEDLIERIAVFTKFQLQNTVFPTFDPVYRVNKQGYHFQKKKRAHAREVREKSMVAFYHQIHELVGMLAELLDVQILTDITVLHISTLGISPFFVENVSELQLSSLKLVTTIFTQYEKHRRLVLDDILASIARLPSTKRNLRTFKLSGCEENIQMLTALVLQLIQSVTYLPDKFGTVKNVGNKYERDEFEKSKADREVQIANKFDTAMRTAGNFLSVFLSKCGSKSEDCDYRVLFENFVQDLLSTVNKPQWPAAELLLSLLGTLLVQNLGNKSLDVSMRVASLEYLGVAASRLRKDAVSAQVKMSTIDRIIADIKAEENDDSQPSNLDPESVEYEQEKIEFLQRILLDYLAAHGQSDPALMHSRHFYIASWYKSASADISKSIKGDTTQDKSKQNKRAKKRKKRRSASSEEDSEGEDSDIQEITEEDGGDNTKILELVEKRRTFLLSKIRPFSDPLISRKKNAVQSFVDDKSAELVTRYLASKKPFSASFDFFLTRILSVSMESAVAIRTKALRCLTMVVEADASVLARKDMQLWVRNSFLDHSTAVREAAVDLIGKYVLQSPDLIDKYYEQLSVRILDTGVSVRKRVIKILRDICVECPDFPKVPEICVKMIRRVNDEDGIRKLVMDVFHSMWFTPVREDPLDITALLRKVSHITDVVTSCESIGLDFFEQLLLSLFKPKDDMKDSLDKPREQILNPEPPKVLVTASTQIVNCLVEHVLRTEEKSTDDEQPAKRNSERFIACVATLVLFAKIRPQLLVEHAITLQGYLAWNCENHAEFVAVSNICTILELVVPLLVNPSQTFLAQLEEDCVKLLFKNDKACIDSCLACLGAVVNQITHNYKLIRDVFRRFQNVLLGQMKLYRQDPLHPKLFENRPLLRRAVYTIGSFFRYFDFTNPEVYAPLNPKTVEIIFNELMSLLEQPPGLWISDLKLFSIQAIGKLCIRHYNFMLGNDLKRIYHQYLTSTTDENIATQKLKIQTLQNIQLYLVEEELRMIKQDKEWSKNNYADISIKEMLDVTSGMASTIVQIYLKQVLESFLSPELQVRVATAHVVQLVLQQGLVHPIQIVPYLICMSTDDEPGIAATADKQLQDMEKKHPQFLQSQVLNGIRLSLQLQRILAGYKGPALPGGGGPSTSTSTSLEGNNHLVVDPEIPIVRGYRVRPKETPLALNGFLYSLLRTAKPQRRAIALLLLKQFDEQNKNQLSNLLYYADNLAYFPYQVVDEPLFLIHHVDIVISVTGSNLLQSFKESLTPLHPPPEPSVVVPPPVVDQTLPSDDPDEPEVVFINTVSAAQNTVASASENMTFVLNELTGEMEGVAGPATVNCTDKQEQPNPSSSTNPPPEQPKEESKASKIADILEDDEDEDVDSLLNRLPENPKSLEEFTIGCQACLLLLMLKQHLKDSYGITDTRISGYSPSDATKAYDRPVTRRQTSVFDPKCTISNLKTPPSAATEESRRALIEQYLHFKQLMLRIDPEDGDDDGEVKQGKLKIDQTLFTQPASGDQQPQQKSLHVKFKPLPPSPPSSDGGKNYGFRTPSQYAVHQSANKAESAQSSSVTIPKLIIVPLKFPGNKGGEAGKKVHKVKADHHHHHKHKKSKPKKKKKKYAVSDDDDTDNSDADPDFHI